MPTHNVVSQQDWLKARLDHLAKEKAFDRQRDQLSAERQALPWVKVEKDYVFQSTEGPNSLSDLFDGRSQLIVYHFMYGPDWEAGCPSCSLLADNFERAVVHLNQQSVSDPSIPISRTAFNTAAMRDQAGCLKTQASWSSLSSGTSFFAMTLPSASWESVASPNLKLPLYTLDKLIRYCDTLVALPTSMMSMPVANGSRVPADNKCSNSVIWLLINIDLSFLTLATKAFWADTGITLEEGICN